MEKIKKEKEKSIKIKEPSNTYIYKGSLLCKLGYVFKPNSLVTDTILKEISTKEEFKNDLKNFIELSKYTQGGK